MTEPMNLLELEELAAAKLDPSAYDYYRSGAGDELTLGRNRTAFDDISLLPFVLRDVAEIDTRVKLFGGEVSMPVLVAPTAFHRLADPAGESATARAAAGADTVFCLSTLSNTTIEQVAEEAADCQRWFQLYVFRDREWTRDLVDRATAAGYRAIVLTVDAPVLGRRERDLRNAFSLPDGLSIASVPDGAVEGDVGTSGLAAYFASMLDASLDWSDLEWLVSNCELPVIVKGVHRADDAERAIESGAAGVVVSNHGARQLDTVPATIEMLPPIADAIGGRAPILLDGGVRRGIDVVKALALGADAVMLGRPILYALASGGEQGVLAALELMRGELLEAMALCGIASIDAIGHELIA